MAMTYLAVDVLAAEKVGIAAGFTQAVLAEWGPLRIPLPDRSGPAAQCLQIDSLQSRRLERSRIPRRHHHANGCGCRRSVTVEQRDRPILGPGLGQ